MWQLSEKLEQKKLNDNSCWDVNLLESTLYILRELNKVSSVYDISQYKD